MLKDLNLLPVYDSAEHDLIQDLIVPLLQNSKLYLRGVGFFTSGWLRLAIEGVAGLIENSGAARIVISPILERSDWEAFQLGEEAKCNEMLKNVLEKQVVDIATTLKKDTLNALAWMIADNIMEFRFAVAREYKMGSDYHDKVGVFIDEEGNRVAIHGSFNDTVKGSLNGEAFSVFKSWEEGQYPFAEQHHKRLTELWERGNRQFRIFTIPEAIRQKIMRLRTSDHRPYIKPATTEILPLSFTDSLQNPFNLYPYQEEAIQSWISANCQGVFEMATGTGKTLTSLSAALNRFNEIGRLALIILVPYLHLLEQWEKDCIKVGFNPILCSSAHRNWHIKVKTKIQDFNIKALQHICIMAVHATASTDRFAKATKDLKPEHTMIIGDEVHGLGAPILKQAMISNTGMRLGLSATPRRWFDEEGTKVIFTYFGPVCFEFPLEKAIGKYLTPYEYKPELVNLNVEEMEMYEDLTARITLLIKMLDDNNLDIEEELKRLLLERARVVASAEEKLDKLLIMLRDMIEQFREREKLLNHILIYCAPGSHKKVLRAVADLGLKCHEFVHTVSLNDRQKILEQFANGDIQVIVAIKCLDEGVDVPSTRTAFFMASTSNPREFVQRRGRILRLAEGKDKAIVYDFIVVPRPEYVPLKREMDAGLLKKEMPRFAEFASVAKNEFEARSKLWNLLNHYELLNLFDEKPWDIYKSTKSIRGYDV
jgi:superfamily II DNA or RNA helicase